MIALALTRSRGTDDPLGPVDQDADRIREVACRLVASARTCSPVEPRPMDPPAGGGSGWAEISAIFEILVWVVFVALVAALVLVLVRVALTTRFGVRRRHTRRGRDAADEAEELTPAVGAGSREPSEWRRDAELHRAAGQHRDAVRCRYRALVGDLARCGLIDEIPGRTSGEERNQMSTTAPQAAPAFDAAAELFDRAWFGHMDVREPDVERIVELEARILAGACVPAP